MSWVTDVSWGISGFAGCGAGGRGQGSLRPGKSSMSGIHSELRIEIAHPWLFRRIDIDLCPWRPRPWAGRSVLAARRPAVMIFPAALADRSARAGVAAWEGSPQAANRQREAALEGRRHLINPDWIHALLQGSDGAEQLVRHTSC